MSTTELDAACARAKEARVATEALRAELAALNREAKPARTAIRARDEAAQQLAELRAADAERRADELARGRRVIKSDPGLALAERALADAQRDAEAGDALMARLRHKADGCRAKIAAAEEGQRDATKALVRAEHRAALVAWDAATEALGAAMTRLDVASSVASRLRVDLGGSDARGLRLALSREGLVLSSWAAAGRARPEWLRRGADAEAVAERAAALLAVAGLAADHFEPMPHSERSTCNAATDRGLTVSTRSNACASSESPQPRNLDFGPRRPTGPVLFTRTGIQ